MPDHIPRQGPATAWVGAAWLQQLRTDPRRWRLALRDRWAFARTRARSRAVWSWADPGPGIALTAHLTVRAIRLLRPHRGGR